jgi:hypothetical protein
LHRSFEFDMPTALKIIASPSVVALAALVAILSFGCRPQSDRLAVSGKVTLNGAPLDGGSIRFTSTGGETLVASGAMIQNGAYHVPQEKGLLPGTYHVEINSPDRDAPMVMARVTPGGPGIQVAPDRIPAEYNSASTKTIEVTPEGENEFDFNIVTKPAK